MFSFQLSYDISANVPPSALENNFWLQTKSNEDYLHFMQILFHFFTKYIKLEVIREHRPSPNVSTIELLNDFCRASVLCVLTMWQFFQDPDRDPKWTPGSG